MNKQPDTNTRPAEVETIVDWLVDGAPGVTRPQDVLQVLCERLVAAGVTLSRAGVFVSTLHPNVMGRSFHWRVDEREVGVNDAPYSIRDSDMYLRSPVRLVAQSGEELRCRILDADCRADLAILDELRADGVTDYVAMPLKFTSGETHSATWGTRAPGGFSARDIAALRRVQPALARVAEIYAHRRTARNLLDAYLGRQSGDKVLRGQIKRGDGEDIHAVIWFCDLRGSTPLADSMTRLEFLGLLNDYFECMAGAVLAHDGEVLRFIGDAVLAIFPVAEAGWSEGEACAAAVAAANDAIAGMHVLNDRRREGGDTPLAFGIGLHLGDVMYGNIGTPTRIEFTVVGAAANEAARIEAMCKTLDQHFVVSGKVVERAPGQWQSLGRHALRGVGSEMELFTPIVTKR